MRVTTKAIHDRLGSDSHDRAIDAVDDDRPLIESGELDDEYLVLLPDSSQGAHYTQIGIDRWGHLQAWCDCAHVEYQQELCAHILTLLLSGRKGIETVDNEPITPRDRYDMIDEYDGPVDLTNDDSDDIDPDPITVDDDHVDTGDGITVDGGIETDDHWSDRL